MMIGGGGSFLCTCCSRGGYTITEDACMTILLSESVHISYDAIKQDLSHPMHLHLTCGSVDF